MRVFRTSIFVALIIAVQAVILYWLGQGLICGCGYVKLWEGVVLSPGNSQHLTDWYTFSHVAHGFLFYALLSWLFPNMPVWTRLVIAVGIEASWEVIENTPMVINHYRQQALAQGYVGDSIINSVMDTVTAIVGFVLARRLPVWLSVALVVGMELFVLYSIRDNLMLNILNLIHQFPAISDWQAGG